MHHHLWFVKQKLTGFHPSCFAFLNTMCSFKGHQVVPDTWHNMHWAWDLVSETKINMTEGFVSKARKVIYFERFKLGPNMRLTLYTQVREQAVQCIFKLISICSSNMSSLEAVADNYEKYWQSASSIQIKSSWAYWIHHGPVRWIILFNSDSYWEKCGS